MKRIFKNLFIIGILTILFFLPSKLAKASTNTIKTPLIVSINTSGNNITRPLVTGLVQKEVDVKVYINNEFIDYAHINESLTETNNFYFQPSFHLSEGVNYIKLISVNNFTGEQSSPTKDYEIMVQLLSPPVLINPNEQIVTGKVKPLIQGLTVSGTMVHVYIDGVYNGKTKLIENKSGTANFAYEPFLNLTVGKHSVYAVAENSQGKKSKISNISHFKIEPPLPPATLIKVIENKVDQERPIVTGLVKNDLFVKVFVDKEINGMFKVKNHDSGTANFAYTVKSKLAPGKHLVYVVTIDNRGKESVWSNFVTATVANELLEPIISEKAAEEIIIKDDQEIKINKKNDSVAESEPVKLETEDKNNQVENKEVETNAPTLQNQKNSKIDDEVEDILNTKISTTSEQASGAINEDEVNQGKSFSVLIFTIFLIAVISWIFWVNKELIKEKSKTNENLEKKE